MKKAEMIDLFEALVRSHALLDGNRTHIPQSQASEQSFAATLYVSDCVERVRKELKK